MRNHGSGRRKCPWETQFQAEKNKLPLFPDRMNSCTFCFQFEHSGGCWTQKPSPKSIIKMPGNKINKCYLHFQFPKKTTEGSALGETDVLLCPSSFPHCNIHKSPNTPVMFAQETPPNRGGFEARSLIPGQWLLPTTGAKFSLFLPGFSPLAAAHVHNSLPPEFHVFAPPAPFRFGRYRSH